VVEQELVAGRDRGELAQQALHVVADAAGLAAEGLACVDADPHALTPAGA